MRITGPNYMALLTAEFCAYGRHSPLKVQALNFCASCVSEEWLVTWSTHAHKQIFPANLWNTLDASAELPAYSKQSHEMVLPKARTQVACKDGVYWGLPIGRVGIQCWTSLIGQLAHVSVKAMSHRALYSGNLEAPNCTVCTRNTWTAQETFF